MRSGGESERWQALHRLHGVVAAGSRRRDRAQRGVASTEGQTLTQSRQERQGRRAKTRRIYEEAEANRQPAEHRVLNRTPIPHEENDQTQRMRSRTAQKRQFGILRKFNAFDCSQCTQTIPRVPEFHAWREPRRLRSGSDRSRCPVRFRQEGRPLSTRGIRRPSKRR